MQLIVIEYEALGLFLTGAALFVTILSWWWSSQLKDKKDGAVNEVRIDKLEERIRSVEEELKYLRRHTER